MATVRPPRKGPMQRQRISPKSFGSKGGPPCTSESASVLSMEWRGRAGNGRVQPKKNPNGTPRETQAGAIRRGNNQKHRHLPARGRGTPPHKRHETCAE